MKAINKSQLVVQIKKDMQETFEKLKAAALATYEDATHEESKPENEYDTRGLEASYLAGAQGKRLAELEELFVMYKFLPLIKHDKNSAIQLSALIEVTHNDKTLYLFLVPKGGGQSVHFDGLTIQIVASSSPLGESLLGLKAEDTAFVESGSRTLEYEIISVQ
jgi:transcription elongation GreA/GreB family factor